MNNGPSYEKPNKANLNKCFIHERSKKQNKPKFPRFQSKNKDCQKNKPKSKMGSTFKRSLWVAFTKRTQIGSRRRKPSDLSRYQQDSTTIAKSIRWLPLFGSCTKQIQILYAARCTLYTVLRNEPNLNKCLIYGGLKIRNEPKYRLFSPIRRIVLILTPACPQGDFWLLSPYKQFPYFPIVDLKVYKYRKSNGKQL